MSRTIARHKGGVLSYDSDVLIDQLFAKAKRNAWDQQILGHAAACVCHVLTRFLSAPLPLLLTPPLQ